MGIDTYLTVMFWLGVIGLACRGFMMITADYPRKSQFSLGADTLGLIFGIAMFVWVCLLKFN